ncbi:MAG: glycoside hydrolase 5 family protein [Pseudobacter sp.]|uniref:glycoside hydrolase 5 family protein n=1 Tax=Pseudobacter sp. TaxID=2045420 RepID=UPI003F8182E4
MKRKKIKYYRLSFALIAVSVLFVVTGGFAKALAFFSRGADRTTALHIPSAEPDLYTPLVRWLPSVITGREPGSYNQQVIAREYIKSWYGRNYSQSTGKQVYMKDHFTDQEFLRYTANAGTEQSGYTFQTASLQHRLRMHYFSQDGQIAAFTDENMISRTWLFSNNERERICSVSDTADFDVIMLLKDGNWRVTRMERKPPRHIVHPDTLKKDTAGIVTVQDSRFYVSGKPFSPVGINYYPAAAPWGLFWPGYDSAVVSKDLKLMEELGFNLVRIFVNFHDFNRGNVSPARLLQLRHFLNQASAHNLKVIVTLFDFMGDYSLPVFAASDRQMETLLTSFRDHPAIFAWDLKNEPDLDFNHHPRAHVMEWLEWMLQRARTYDPVHLITIGWAHADNALLFKNQVDFIAFHSYLSPALLEGSIESLRSGSGGKPLLLEETGMSTYQGFWTPSGHSEKDQADYLKAIQELLAREKVTGYLVWTLYDFSEVPAGVAGRLPWRRKPQGYFGILHSDGRPKPAAALFR